MAKTARFRPIIALNLVCVMFAAVGSRAVLAQRETAKLTATDADAGDSFGHSVDISGDWAVIGAYRDQISNGAWDAGSVYVYRRHGNAWVGQAKLTASDASPGDWFGFSVAIDGDVILVGSKADDDNGSASGSVYVFRFDGVDWIEEAKLTASDGARDDEFGHSVALDDDVVVVGAPQNNLTGPGWSYVYRLDGVQWVEEAKLVASDGQAEDDFGISVSVSGDVALIGAWNVGNTGRSYPDGAGAAYFYRFDGLSWVEEARVVSITPLPGELDRFGRSVSVEGDVAIIGTEPITTSNPVSPAGSVHVFGFDGVQWSGEAKLIASDDEPGDRFGTSVDLDGSRAVVGCVGRMEHR